MSLYKDAILNILEVMNWLTFTRNRNISPSEEEKENYERAIRFLKSNLTQGD